MEHAGAFSAARLLHERVLDSQSRTLGPQHPDTLTSRNHLANALFGMGEPAEAIRLLRQTLEDRNCVLGRAHPDTLISRHDLACALDGTGQHAEAVSLLRQTLADRVRVLGVVHPHTLASRDSLGPALDGMGEHAEAVRLHRQTLDDRIRVLGPEHPHTVRTRDDLETASAARRAAQRRQTWLRPSRRLEPPSQAPHGGTGGPNAAMPDDSKAGYIAVYASEHIQAYVDIKALFAGALFIQVENGYHAVTSRVLLGSDPSRPPMPLACRQIGQRFVSIGPGAFRDECAGRCMVGGVTKA
ncbi:tetratricopeptide repeat protein [Streptomyces phaeochromogenes]|uniref:tetratricopeptide repeat protein n=1 Tax=Streptomyces phaeochromogenes TaxID=1923 RepID=UPI00340C7A3E